MKTRKEIELILYSRESTRIHNQTRILIMEILVESKKNSINKVYTKKFIFLTVFSFVYLVHLKLLHIVIASFHIEIFSISGRVASKEHSY